ncbi:hypothetical protein RHSIM_Rhsim01G0233300 [Rhododendron simsii]|uniref:Uncharacterized protein n=1 Tax=Rhododendron simsii TaxID=118357 RepID=A0A834HDJ8_RHOSS|nr:hypothetical protein RHSIM_Rhsim01G0233300 [Rhododendron simsii]
MENKKQLGSSSSAADLLGSMKSPLPSSGAGIFASIFPPPPSVGRRNYSCSDLVGCLQEQSTRDEVWSTRQFTSEITADKSCITNKEKKSIFLERVETSPLSSSLYYGGQEDMYVCSSSTKSSGAYPFVSLDWRMLVWPSKEWKMIHMDPIQRVHVEGIGGKTDGSTIPEDVAAKMESYLVFVCRLGDEPAWLFYLRQHKSCKEEAKNVELERTKKQDSRDS